MVAGKLLALRWSVPNEMLKPDNRVPTEVSRRRRDLSVVLDYAPHLAPLIA